MLLSVSLYWLPSLGSGYRSTRITVRVKGKSRRSQLAAWRVYPERGIRAGREPFGIRLLPFDERVCGCMRGLQELRTREQTNGELALSVRRTDAGM